MIDFEKDYQTALRTPTDINEHLPVLSDLASKCSHVTELGVGWAQSTRAFLRNDVVLHSYEYMPQPGIEQYFEECKKSGRNVTLHVADTRLVEIEPTDMMLVDSLHVYEQVKEELRLHADKVKKFIVFHDTTTFESVGEFGGKGIWPAVQEFLEDHSEWQIKERRTNNNGLTVLQRV